MQIAGNRNLATSISDFSLDLYLIVVLSTNNTNIILSPLSVQTVLSLLFCGTAPNTATSIESALFISDDSRPQIAQEFHDVLLPFQHNSLVHMATAIYVDDQYELVPAYQQMASTQFFTNVSTMNFGQSQTAAATINANVARETNNVITNFVDPVWLNGQTELVLVNAIYFNGLWKHKFSQIITQNVTFLNDMDRCKPAEFPVDMMNVKVYTNMCCGRE